jgi:oligopeptide/dipeptide ABC transporter ATP-binding protein
LEHLLTVDDLSTVLFTRRGAVEAVRGVSFEVGQAETIGLVGESGCGKTMTALSIMGLLPSTGRIMCGQVVLKGRDLSGLTERQLSRIRGREMAMIFQDPMTSLNPVLRIGRQMTETLVHHEGLSKREARERAIELLDEVGIPAPRERLDDYPHQLSGGMRQRVMIAMATSCKPSLVIADEPTTALDVTVQAGILELFGKLQERHLMGIIWITHDLGVIAGLTEMVFIMYAGKIVERAPTDTLFQGPLHPYTRALLSCRPQIGGEPRTALPSIGGVPPNLVDPPQGCAFLERCPYGDDQCLEEPPFVGGRNGQHQAACWKIDAVLAGG